MRRHRCAVEPAPTRTRAARSPIGPPRAVEPTGELLAPFRRPCTPEIPAGSAVRSMAPAPRASARSSRALVAPARPLIRLYGPLRIDPADHPALRHRAVRGLIAYLLLVRPTAALEELGAALWPDAESAAARSRLHKAKQQANGALCGAIERTPSGYGLPPERVSTDVAEIALLATAPGGGPAELERAVALSRGVPLANVDYAFLDGERRRLTALRIELLARAAEARLEARDPHGALALAEELVTVDVFHEGGWRLAMRAEDALGQRAAVVDRYRRLCAALDAELGLTPQPETRSLYRTLLAQR